MQLDGIHHMTCITADARRNVDFYAPVPGLRLVKETANVDASDVYHLYYGDERGAPGSTLTFAFRDAEGLGLELAVVESGDEPLRAAADGIPSEHALLGFDGVRPEVELAGDRPA
jgi:glyoxalase family protein